MATSGVLATLARWRGYRATYPQPGCRRRGRVHTGVPLVRRGRERLRLGAGEDVGKPIVSRVAMRIRHGQPRGLWEAGEPFWASHACWELITSRIRSATAS
jgi:hypothetical protein